MSNKRPPDAWALQIQLEKEEQRVAELTAENKLLQERIAHLEAERYSVRPRPEYATVAQSLADSYAAIHSRMQSMFPSLPLSPPARALGAASSPGNANQYALASYEPGSSVAIKVNMDLGGPHPVADMPEEKPAETTRFTFLEWD